MDRAEELGVADELVLVMVEVAQRSSNGGPSTPNRHRARMIYAWF